MVTTRMTVVEHAKQLVSHGAHAADIEVVEGLLAELEKSKKTIESLQQFTRKQFELVRMSEPLQHLQPSHSMIADGTNAVLKLQEAAHDFEVFRNQWKVDNPDSVDSTEEGHKFEYLNNANEPFIMNGGAEVYMALPALMRHARPPLEQYDDVVPELSRSKE